MDCIFCKIIAREIPGFIIEEDADVIVFLSLENHPLVVPKKHIPDVFELDGEDAARIMRMATRIARATRDALGSDGIYLTQANGAAAGQDVFHYHLHVYPKWDDKRVIHTDPESREGTMAKIREKLQNAK